MIRERATLTEAIALAAAVPIVDAFRRAGRLHPDGTIDTRGLPADALVALEYVARITDVVDATPAGFVLGERYRGAGTIDFDLQKFVGSYAVTTPFDVERACFSMPPDNVEEAARGYEAFGEPPDTLLVTLALEKRPRCVLDLACGPARVTLELLRRDPEVEVMAVDREAAMCASAERRLAAAGVAHRAHVFCGDASHVATVVPAELLARVDLVVGGSVLNAMFGDGDASAIAFLERLDAALPGRPFLALDYYGALRAGETADRLRHHTLLQDLVQQLSGQGVPPGRLEDWYGIIDSAGSRLQSGVHGDDDGLRWFIYEIGLGAGARAVTAAART